LCAVSAHNPCADVYHLLPQFLMKDPQSPVLDFYPTDFRVDQEGKRNDWEGIVLVNLPFHDRKKLLTFGIVLVTHPLMMKFLLICHVRGT
jgi:5'-3' exonuclease